MAAAQGQVTWETQGTGTNDYIVPFETEKNIAHEFRFRSAFGKLSKPMKSMTVGSGPEQRELDVGESAAIWSKEISSGDEVRFTLEQNMRGAPTYGDAEVRVGDYLAYLHQNIILNKLDTPAVPVIEEMSAMRVKEVISNPESRIRGQITMYLAEQYTYDVLDGFFKGMSRNLQEPKANGGRALDLGLGAGVQCSPENFLIAGSGFVSGTGGSAGYETQLVTDLGGLEDTAGDYITRDFIHNMRYAVSQRKVAPMAENDGREVWYCPTDPHLMARLTKPGMPLFEAWKFARERGEKNPVFGHGSLELDGFIFYPEERLKQYRPILTGGALLWGSNAPDKREVTVTSNIALMMVLGNGAILEGHNGAVSITYDEGRHGKGKTIAGHVKQSFMRAVWKPKDGRAATVRIQQGSMACAFYEPGLEF